MEIFALTWLTTPVAIALGALIVSAASLMSLVIIFQDRKGEDTQNVYVHQLERRIELCEEDRKQLHTELEACRGQVLWLTQELSRRK